MKLVVFDIDSTLARIPTDRVWSTSPASIMAVPAWPNAIDLCRQYLARKDVELMFCTGRLQEIFRPTWAWLNQHLALGTSGKRVTLTCRPNDLPTSAISAFKVKTLTQAIARVRPTEVLIYDDDLRNLQLFETLRPLCRRLRLFKAQDGVLTPWTL